MEIGQFKEFRSGDLGKKTDSVMGNIRNGVEWVYEEFCMNDMQIKIYRIRYSWSIGRRYKKQTNKQTMYLSEIICDGCFELVSRNPIDLVDIDLYREMILIH